MQKRNDGFHNIETIFYPVPLKDVLEIVHTPTAKKPANIILHNYGLPVNGPTTDNLCVKAYHLLKKDFNSLPAITTHLLKNIPMGAGLGGGSADGAFMLTLLNNKFTLNLSTTQLIHYALQLGSDCPFFIINEPCYATSRGEILEHISLALSNYNLVLATPGIHVNTGWAFSQLTIPEINNAPDLLKQIIQQPVPSWKNNLINHFEKPVFEKHPELQQIKENLYQQGAVYAAMSGSGSTIFGLFAKKIPLPASVSSLYTVINL